MDAKDDIDIGLFHNAVESSSIALMVHDVAKEDEEKFIEWQHEITKETTKHPGYQRTLIFKPVKGGHKEWITSVHFETQEELDAYLGSPEREKWLEEHPPAGQGHAR